MKKVEVIKKKNVVLITKGRKITGGVDTGRDAIVVYVTKKVHLNKLSKEDIVPEKIDGIESDVQVTKMIKALARTGKYRPMPGGVSGGHPNVSAGTISPLRIEEIIYIVSNSHVSGDCNNGELGDPTWQPGKADGGGPADVIGHLYIRPLIHFEGGGGTCPWANGFVNFGNFLARLVRSHYKILPAIYQAINKVDCAVSLPIDPDDIREDILDIGIPAGFAEAQLNEAIKKSGRTSELTHGTVLDTDGIARVNYGSHGNALFNDQIITTAIASPGDSGSLVFNEINQIVGLLFGGNDSFTIVNKIRNVLDALGLKGG